MRKAPVFGGGLLVSRHRKDSHSSVSRSPGFWEMKYSATRLELQRFRQVVTPIPNSLRAHSVSEPEPTAAISILYGVPSPAPGVLQTFRNRVRVARAERARMVCRVWCVRALDGRLSVLVWHNGSWPHRDGMVHLGCAVNLDSIDVASACAGARGSRHPFDAMTCACVACNPITRRYPVGACGVVDHHGASWCEA